MPVDPAVPQRSYDVRIAQRKVQRPISGGESGGPADLTPHTGDASGAHAATAISTTGGTVQSDIDYLGGAVDGLSTSISTHTHSYAATSHTHSYAATSHTHSYADSGHTHSAGNLDSLSDVDITAPSANQVLKFNGTSWVNGTDATGGGSGDLTAHLDDTTDAHDGTAISFVPWGAGSGLGTVGTSDLQGAINSVDFYLTALNTSYNAHAADTSVHFALGTTPSTQAVGDSAAGGSATTAAKTDHKHAMPSFGTPGSSATGDVAAAGSSANIARADHVHGREAFGASASTQAFGDSASAGAAATPSRSDHKHAMPARPYSRNIDYSIGKLLVVENDVFRWYNKTGRTLTIDKIWASLGTVSSSGSVVFDVKKGTTSLWTSTGDRPTITANGNVSTTTAPNTTTIADGEYLRFDVISIGTGSGYAIISVDLSA